MSAPLDLDQLRTFIAIIECGSFTRAAEEVGRTQSAVSMQMRRLEERIARPLFTKNGRGNRLTEDGERLLDHARKLIRLSNETIAAFDAESLTGMVRIGVPDDYAERYMPDIIARFAKTNPHVELFIVCESSRDLAARIERNELDIAVVTHNPRSRPSSRVIRTEPLYWVGSLNHHAHEETPVSLAVGRHDCTWRRLACSALDSVGRAYRIPFTSWSSTVVASAVLAGLAVSLLPESALRPGMRVLSAADGFPSLAPVQIGMMRRPGAPAELIDALGEHIVASLDDLADPRLSSEPGTLQRASRSRAGHLPATW
ncbi:LysR substrate-binding domain-containing protein [Pararhizobium mangrovi]|uniref:HTH-type transcriptional regulator TtuA n=1 Tax=Pararhizobium mangrovi TaxID=2590452 RepID=A0A506U1R5_9HYPH|nr:LysR substrate-binding domain-containing protein [Pararhizobium mangrovi]TPW27396.1 LysR family transcriptional regulator [Pararhizobium mangrovi]